MGTGRQASSDETAPAAARDRRPEMKWLPVLAGAGALVFAAIIYAACSRVSSQEPTTTVRAGGEPAATASPAPGGAPAATATGEPAKPAKPEAKVVYAGPNVKAVALTFDTGVGAGHTAEILDVLKEHGTRATFGITGQWAITNPGLLKRIVLEGHAVINHSWSHPSFTGVDTETPPLTADQIVEELERAEAKVKEIAGVTTKPFFRVPYGDFNPFVNQVAHEAGYDYDVLWTLDAMGWAGRPTEAVVSVSLSNAKNGAIFLYHVDNPREYAALDEIIKGMDERGFQMVTIPQLLGTQPMPTPTPHPSPAPSPSPAPTPTPTPDPYVTIALDDFESGAANGGTGWAQPWWSLPFVIARGAAHSGSRYLDMAATGTALRSAAIQPGEELHVRFWARFESMGAGDKAFVRLSDDGVNWTVYSVFRPDRNDGTWYPYDITVSFPSSSQRLYLRFQAQMSGGVWGVDDAQVATLAP